MAATATTSSGAPQASPSIPAATPGSWTKGDNRVQEFNSSGTWLASLGGTSRACTNCLCTGPSTCPSSSGSGNGQFNQPDYLTIDSGNNIWVVDQNNNRVEEFSSSGSFRSFLQTFGSSGTGNGQFNNGY